MKKLLTLLALVFALTAPLGIAYATDAENKICQLATENEKVLDAKCVIYQRACVIAIKTEKFCTRSEYEDYVNTLVDNVKSQFQVDHVFVSRNPRIMQQIDSLSKLSGDEREKEINRIIEKELSKSRDGGIIMPKKVW